MKKPKQLLLVILCGIFFGIMVFSAYKLISDKVVHRQAQQMDEGASKQYALNGQASATPRPYGEGGEIILDDEISPLNSMYDLNAFYSQYPDAVGWIYSPDTPIDYGIVQGEDNDFYLHRFYDGTYSIGGSLFVDCNCNRDFSNQNTVVYGHHMNDGSKLATISDYRQDGYYEKHPVMYLSTPAMNYRVEIFAGYVTDADSDTYTFRFDSDTAYQDYLKRMCAQSDFKANVTLGTGDRIITLSTCSYEYYDARYVVQGKLVPIH